MKRLFVVVALVVGMLMPVCALASPIDGFKNGLDDMVNPKVEQETQEQIVLTGVGDENVRAGASDPITSIRNWVGSLQVTYGGATVSPNYKLYNYGRFVLLFLTTGPGLAMLTAAVGLCFMWWGVRKAIRIIMNAFRSGRLSFGGRNSDYNSYYYGTKPSDWR